MLDDLRYLVEVLIFLQAKGGEVLREFTLGLHKVGGEHQVPIVEEGLVVNPEQVLQAEDCVVLHLLILVSFPAFARGILGVLPRVRLRGYVASVDYQGTATIRFELLQVLLGQLQDLGVALLPGGLRLLKLDVEHLLGERRAKEEDLIEVQEQFDALVVIDHEFLIRDHLIHTQLEGADGGGQGGDVALGPEVLLYPSHLKVEEPLQLDIDNLCEGLHELGGWLQEQVGQAIDCQALELLGVALKLLHLL